MKKIYQGLKIQLTALVNSDVVTASSTFGTSTFEEGTQVDTFGIE